MTRSHILTALVALALVFAIGGDVVLFAYDGCGDEGTTELSIGSTADAEDSCHNCICIGSTGSSTGPAIAPHESVSTHLVVTVAAPVAPAPEIFLPPRLAA